MSQPPKKPASLEDELAELQDDDEIPDVELDEGEMGDAGPASVGDEELDQRMKLLEERMEAEQREAAAKQAALKQAAAKQAAAKQAAAKQGAVNLQAPKSASLPPAKLSGKESSPNAPDQPQQPAAPVQPAPPAKQGFFSKFGGGSNAPAANKGGSPPAAQAQVQAQGQAPAPPQASSSVSVPGSPGFLGSSPTAVLPPPQITADAIKGLVTFLVERTKVYEEIGFETILRKIPPDWNIRTEATLIDLLEKILAHGKIHGKMTAHSLKFYASPPVEIPRSSPFAQK